MKLGDFLNTMAAKVGVQNDPNFVAILSNAALATAEINDEIANRLNTGLMSFEGAKNNGELKSHFTASALNGVDAQLNRIASQYGEIDGFTTEKNTFKRMDILSEFISKQIADLKSKSPNDVTKDAEVKRLTTELANMQTQLAQLTDSKNREIADLTARHANEILQSRIDYALTGKNYANKQLPNVEIAKTLLNAELAAKGAKVINDNGVLKLKQTANPEMDFVDDGFKPVGFDAFVDKLLADKSMLAVSKPTPQQQIIVPTGAKLDTAKFEAAASAAIADLGVGNV